MCMQLANCSKWLKEFGNSALEAEGDYKVHWVTSFGARGYGACKHKHM